MALVISEVISVGKTRFLSSFRVTKSWRVTPSEWIVALDRAQFHANFPIYLTQLRSTVSPCRLMVQSVKLANVWQIKFSQFFFWNYQTWHCIIAKLQQRRMFSSTSLKRSPFFRATVLNTLILYLKKYVLVSKIFIWFQKTWKSWKLVQKLKNEQNYENWSKSWKLVYKLKNKQKGRLF